MDDELIAMVEKKFSDLIHSMVDEKGISPAVIITVLSEEIIASICATVSCLKGKTQDEKKDLILEFFDLLCINSLVRFDIIEGKEAEHGDN